MILDESAPEIAGDARFTCLLENIVSRAILPDVSTENLIEKTLINLDRSDLSRLWNNYRYPVLPSPVYPPVVNFNAFPQAPMVPVSPVFDDAFDPYASRTDNKASVAITDLLEKPHGKSASNLNEALAKFRNIRRAGRVPRFFAYSKLITAAAKENQFNLCRDILEMAKQDVPFLPQYRVVRFGWVSILDSMLSACLTVGRRDLAAQYHQDLLNMGASPSANTYGLYITTLKENTKTFDEATEAVKIFLRAKAEGVEPTSFLYNALIGKLGKARRIDDCLFYFAEMRNLGIRPTSVTYGTIVNALCRVSDEKFAEEIFEEMEACANYKPRPAPYHSLMQHFLTTKRDRSKVLSYYERMRSKGIQPTMHTYKLLIDTHATLEPLNMAEAESVLAEMRAAGEKPEAVHYAALIHAKGCVQQDMAGARALFETVASDSKVKLQPCVYQAMFEALVANRQVADAEPLLAHMAARRVEMTPYIANALIHGWALEKDIVRARQAFDRVNFADREPSTYEAMVRAYLAVEDREGAQAVVGEALSRGYPTAVANKIVELISGGRQ
ncbi:pentatricopeptide repeat protein, partial [Aureobasidium melanogenum]